MTITIPKWLLVLITVVWTVQNYPAARDGAADLIHDITQEARP